MDFKKPSITAILLGLLLFLHPYSALAASGGRMGGRVFSSSSRRSWSSSRSHEHIIRHYHSPAPCQEVKFNATTQGEEFNSTKPVGSGDDFRGFCMFIITILMIMAGVWILLACMDDQTIPTASPKTSVIKLQVGLLGLARSLQKELDRIAEAADTSTLRGLSYILTETTVALLRHQDYCISAHSSVDVKCSIRDGEKHFTNLSTEQQCKFDDETLVNADSIKIQKTTKLAFKGFSNKYIVVTILVAADGVHNLLEINSRADLKEALLKLASIPTSKTQAVEVLWTPQKKYDTLSEREYLEDYPLLRSL